MAEELDDIRAFNMSGEKKAPLLEPMTLRLTKWKDNFSDLHCKLMISKGLNHCVDNMEMSIAGYLITDRNLFLVLRPCGNREEQLEELNRYLIYEIEREYHLQQLLLGNKKTGTTSGLEGLNLALERFPLINDNLVNKLCGKDIDPGYYTSELEKLEDLTINNNFCSVGNYRDKELIGPVPVDTIDE